MGRKRKRNGKVSKAEKSSFGSVLDEDFRPVVKPVKVKRCVDGPGLRRKDLEKERKQPKLPSFDVTRSCDDDV